MVTSLASLEVNSSIFDGTCVLRFLEIGKHQTNAPMVELRRPNQVAGPVGGYLRTYITSWRRCNGPRQPGSFSGSALDSVAKNSHEICSYSLQPEPPGVASLFIAANDPRSRIPLGRTDRQQIALGNMRTRSPVARRIPFRLCLDVNRSPSDGCKEASTAQGRHRSAGGHLPGGPPRSKLFPSPCHSD